MKLESSFSIPVARDRVFAHFLDPDSMRACVPGCVELARVDDSHYRGTLVNEIAHVRFSAGFTAEITELTEPAAVRALLRGEDRKLASSIKVDASLAVREADPASSSVEFELDLAVWGRIGRLGESIIRRRTEEVRLQFVDDFSKVCAAGPPGPDNPAVRELLAPVTEPPAETSAGPATAGRATRPSWWRRLLALFTRGRTGARR
jgi:carbon monoxide dehydrogenase subunit G